MYRTIINRCINKLHIKIDKRIGNDIGLHLKTGIKVTNMEENRSPTHKWDVRK